MVRIDWRYIKERGDYKDDNSKNRGFFKTNKIKFLFAIQIGQALSLSTRPSKKPK